MANLPGSTMKIFLLSTLITMSLLTFTTANTTSTTKSQRLVTKLIHRDSVLSPYFNRNATIADRASYALESSIARLKYLAASTLATNDYRAGVIVDNQGAQFMVNLSIGEPPVPQLLTMDTGSSFLWIQCLPCKSCFEQSSPLFDPSKSSTYHTISCKAPNCIVSSSDKCGLLDNCKFSSGYIDGTTAMGVLGTEKITFVTSDEGVTSIPNVVFGCGHQNEGFDGQPSGVLGLGPVTPSLVAKLGYKFSYCIGNINDPTYTYNQLIIGDGLQIEGDSTPLEVFDNVYYLNLEGISVGEQKLNIDPKVFQRHPSGDGGVAIDSGSTLSFLNKGAHGPLSDQVRSLLDGKLEPIKRLSDPSLVCHKGVITRDLSGFPVVTFHFAGGAELGLDIGSMFQQRDSNQFCMAIRESIFNDLSVIGAMAQQSYNIAYDLAGKKISFRRIDCELLEP